MDWIAFPDPAFVVNGLWWWPETSPRLWRLPARMQPDVPESVWSLAQQPSGARIRFRTDATSIGIRAHYPSLAYMNNMNRIGQLGIDLYVDGEYWRPAYPVDNPDLEDVYCTDLPPGAREISLNLGLYAPVEIKAIGLSSGATISAPAPFAVEKPVVYYGSSITQGGCSSRPGLSYQAILSRGLNLDFINLGFSGSGKGETALALAVAEIDASCYVMDFCQNCATAAALGVVYAPFLATLRDKRPDTPVVCITPIFATCEDFSEERHRELAGMREVIRAAVKERREAGDKHIRLVEGYDLLGPGQREGLVDEVHPNDIGFVSMARGLEPVLREILL